MDSGAADAVASASAFSVDSATSDDSEPSAPSLVVASAIAKASSQLLTLGTSGAVRSARARSARV